MNRDKNLKVVTRVTPYLIIDTFLDVLVKKKYLCVFLIHWLYLNGSTDHTVT